MSESQKLADLQLLEAGDLSLSALFYLEVSDESSGTTLESIRDFLIDNGVESTANKDQPNGYAGLNSSGNLVSSGLIPRVATYTAMSSITSSDDGELGVTSDTHELYILSNSVAGGYRVGPPTPTLLTNPNLIASTPYQLPNARYLIVDVPDCDQAVGSEIFMLPSNMRLGDVIEIYIGKSTAITLTGSVILYMGGSEGGAGDFYDGYMIGGFPGGGAGSFGSIDPAIGIIANADTGVSFRIEKYGEGGTADGQLLVTKMIGCEGGAV